MNIESVFRLKASTASFQNATQKIEQASPPVLQSLEEDRKFNRGFEFALKNILNGNFNEAVIDSLVNPKFDNSGDLQKKTGGDSVTIQGNPIGTSKFLGLKNLNLSPDDAEILKRLFQINSENQQFAKETRLNLKAIGFALENILNGKFNEAVIDSLVDPKFDNVGDLQKKTGGDSVTIQGNRIGTSKFPGLESLNLSPDDAEILKQLFQINSKNQQFAKETRLNLKAIGFALENILNGKFNEAIIDSLVNPKFDNSGYLQKKTGGDSCTIQGDFIRISKFPGLENLNLTQGDAEILKTIQKFCSKPEFLDEYKKNFSEFLSSGDTNILKNFKSSLESQEAKEETQELIQVIDKLVKSTEALNFKKEIYTGIADNRNTDELRNLVNNYEAKDQDDIDLKRELLKATFGKDSQDIIVKTVEKLEERNPDEAIAVSAPLLEINPEAAQGLRKLAYRLELSDYMTELGKRLEEDLNTGSLDFSKSNEFLRSSRLRPAIGELDYIKSIQEIQEKTKVLIEDLITIRARQQATELRGNFGNKPSAEVLQKIDDLRTKEPAISGELRELYKTYATANLPDIFQSLFLPQIQEAKALELQNKFTQKELGGNLEAFKYMQGNFVAVVLPLVESFRANPKTSSEIEVYLKNDRNGVRGKTPFEQRLTQLKKQRDLSDIEENYLRSVERLSLFNPYLVACGAVKPEITSEYLKIHFEKLSNSSKTQIQEGSYVPLIQIGTGPNGLAGIGEIVRNNPELANSMLVIDSGKQPGGPFAVPNGAAWALNSANARGESIRALPAKAVMEEELTVRGFGSPMRWYPGERKEDSATSRQGSINMTVDYLPVPDEISSKRYATNQELQLILAMQAAVLVKNLALETEIVKIEPNQDKDLQGDKIVTLRIKEGDSSRDVKIRTDAVFCSSGLGEPTYGFPVDNTKQAQQILQEQKDDEFPKLSTTLEAFKALADVENSREIKGNTVVIYGGGNSADTLLEYLGQLFNGSNDSANKIEKIYVLLPGELSPRPRYAQIKDLTERNGNPNLIEFINVKVNDVAYASGDDEPSRRLILLDAGGNRIKNKSDAEIVTDYVIAATGFKSKLNEILEGYTQEISSPNKSELKEKLELPTNPDITVAEVISKDPNILIVGTASSSNFNQEKLAQLPRLAREALLRNGAENAVAIGFRGPDTQAAVSIWLNQREITLAENTEKSSSRREIINIIGSNSSDKEREINLTTSVNPEEIKIPNNISDTSLLLEPIFYSSLGNKVELLKGDRRFNGKLNFTLRYNKAEQCMILSFKELGNGLIETKTGKIEAIPLRLVGNIANCVVDPNFQKYALTELNNKRGDNPSLSFSLNFKKGYLDPANSFIDA